MGWFFYAAPRSGQIAAAHHAPNAFGHVPVNLHRAPGKRFQIDRFRMQTES
jgi:hypothetical protein